MTTISPIDLAYALTDQSTSYQADTTPHSKKPHETNNTFLFP